MLLKFRVDKELKKSGALWFADSVLLIVGLRNVADFRSPSRYSKHEGYVPSSNAHITSFPALESITVL